MKYINYDCIVYKKVKNFPRYRVSEHAVVWDTLLNRCLTKYISSSGYQYVYLDKGSRQYPINIHNIVAVAWIENPKNLPEINHEDCNKLNNWASNLCWCTKKQNTEHAVINNRYKKK